MSSGSSVDLDERFASLHQSFEVNTPLIAHVLGEIGLQDLEIDDFQVTFEDRFAVPNCMRARWRMARRYCMKSPILTCPDNSPMLDDYKQPKHRLLVAGTQGRYRN